MSETKVTILQTETCDSFRIIKKVNFITQVKFRSNENTCFLPKDVREFVPILIEQPENTFSFITNAIFKSKMKYTI
jgi:hypothetical protein